MATKMSVDGKAIDIENGQTILEACKEAGIYIPSLCHYPGLTPLPQVVPDMACQLCLVEVDGQIVLSCKTAVASGAKVETNTPRVKELVKRHLGDILRRYPSEHLLDGELKEAAAYLEM